MELKEYLVPLKKWWWLIVGATLVATVSGYLATRQQPFNYWSSTTLLVGTAAENPNPTGNDFWLAQQLATTYVELAQRDTVRNNTKLALSLEVLPAYTVRMIPNTQLIELAVVDTIPARAQAVANELANQLIRLTPANPEQEQQLRQAFINQQLTDLETKITETRDEILKEQGKLAGLFSARQIVDTQNQITALEGKLATLQGNYAALLANTQRGAINTITIVEPAALPTIPIGPNKLYTIILAAAIGFILATGAAYIMEYLDDTFKTPAEIRHHLGLVTLGMVPEINGGGHESQIASLVDSKSMAAEAYRVLRTNLRFTALDKPIRSLLITSTAPVEGKSLTAVNLAVAMAQAGQRVILVDADLRRPRLHRVFSLQNDAGLTTALMDEYPDLNQLLRPAAVPGLRVLTSGSLPPNPTDLFGSARMRVLLNRLLDLADMVIFDSPPATGLADAAILSALVDGALLVLDFGRTRRVMARQAFDGLQQVSARVLGVVLNRIPPRSNGHYYYYYSNHSYGAVGEKKGINSNSRLIGRARRDSGA